MVVNKKQGAAFVVLMLFIFAIPGEINAQAPPGGACPPGAVPIPGQGRCGSPAEAAGINSRGAGNAAPAYTEIWENRFGALVINPKTATLWPVENEKSKRKAISSAFKLCENNQCVLAYDVKNGCIASAWGGGVNFTSAGADKVTAEQTAVEKCRAKESGCKLTYSGCSLPVRVK